MSYGIEGTGMGPKMNVCQGTECTIPAPQESLTEQMFAAADLGRAVQNMTGRIQRSLFGCGSPLGETKEKAPEYFEEVLARHRTELQDTVRVLEEICDRLGV